MKSGLAEYIFTLVEALLQKRICGAVKKTGKRREGRTEQQTSNWFILSAPPKYMTDNQGYKQTVQHVQQADNAIIS